MSELLERRIVACPYHLAQRYLADSVGPAAASGQPGALALTLAVPGGELVKEVVVTYAVAVDPMAFDRPWRIHWAPKAGPYPQFEGELTVRADESTHPRSSSCAARTSRPAERSAPPSTWRSEGRSPPRRPLHCSNASAAKWKRATRATNKRKRG